MRFMMGQKVRVVEDIHDFYIDGLLEEGEKGYPGFRWKSNLIIPKDTVAIVSWGTTVPIGRGLEYYHLEGYPYPRWQTGIFETELEEYEDM